MWQNGNKANNNKVNDQDITKIDGGNITQIIEYDEGTRAHNDMANGDVTLVIDEGKRIKAHKMTFEDMANGQDNTKVNGGDVTLVIDEEKARKAHKKTFEDKFNKPKRKPNNLEERKMIGKAMEVLIVSCMKNHVYRFGNKMKLQSTGGPIGLALTGEVADCFMNKWDKLFVQKCKDMEINLTFYSRFKDDIFISASSLEKGTRIVDGKLVIDIEGKAEDEERCDDDITLEIIRQVAELVNPMIKFTVDIPSEHENKKIAVLDLNVKLNKEKENRIDYEFFQKPTKNPKILLAESAINSSTKRTILTQECLRRMRNTKIELGENVRNKHLNDFMLKMKNSGYGPKYRAQILNSALNAFDKMVEEDKTGKKPLHRSRTWNQENRILAKQNKMKNWYKSVDKSGKVYKSILFVPPTPGSGLLKELKNREEELNKHKKERIKIVEKGGMKIETLLTNKNPFKNEKCEAKGCPVCTGEYGDFKIPCNKNNTGYRWGSCR